MRSKHLNETFKWDLNRVDKFIVWDYFSWYDYYNLLQKEHDFMYISILLKELAKVSGITLTEESVKAFVETKIKPIFTNWGKNESRSIELEECLSEYLLRCYAKNNIMTTIVFGRLQKTLDDLYIPLTLEEYRNEGEKWIVNENCYDVLEKYNRILIVDMAGMGKSTVVKYFACQGVNLDKSIPIVIELRKLAKNQTILEYIQMQINSLDKNIEIEEIVNILNQGDFVIFFDGYDEIANDNKSAVLDTVQEFSSKANHAKIVITSREEEDLNSLGEFKCVNIKPLTNEEAYKLISKYDNDGKISKKLIKRLKEDSTMKVLNEFLKNPLLVSLLYKTFEYKEEIPYKKIDFYAQVYAALFNDHDKTKGSAYVHEKKTGLDKFQFEQILRALAFLSLKIDKLEYSSQLIHQLLEQSIERFGWLKISIDDFLYDITHVVPFIQKDGNEYKWVHKSFMEYFASCFICYDNKVSEEKYFRKMTTDNLAMKYYNVLDFCYELDTLGFRKYVILPYLNDYIEKYKKYFTHEYFNSFDEKAVGAARHLLALNINLYIINNIYVDKVCDLEIGKGKKIEGIKTSDAIRQMFDETRNCIDTSNVRMAHIGFDRFLYAYEDIDLSIYKLIMNRLPELVKELYIEVKETSLEQRDVKIKFTDDIHNPINKDKEVFKIIVDNMFDVVFDHECMVFKYDKCKELIEKIKLEDDYANNDVFDL